MLVRTLPELLISLLAMVSTGWKTMSSAMPAEPVQGRISMCSRRSSHASCVGWVAHLSLIVELCRTLSCIPFQPSPGPGPLQEGTLLRRVEGRATRV